MTKSDRNPNPEFLSLKLGSTPARLHGRPGHSSFAVCSSCRSAPVLGRSKFLIPHSSFSIGSAFTLIELLVVIAIIAVLAAMIFPIVGAVNKVKLRSVAQGGLAQVETAIESYKAKYGFYPPDNPDNPAINQLYYELLGTTFDDKVSPTSYTTLDGSSSVANPVAMAFGTKVTGLVNSTKGRGGDEGQPAVQFLRGVKPGQRMQVRPVAKFCTVLGMPLDGPMLILQDGPIAFNNPSGAKINPWRYNSSSPTNNPNSYDLWIDVLIAGKTNRFSNWSKQPLIVY